VTASIEIVEPSRTSPSPAFDGFGALIAPKGVEEFFGEYWEKRPFFVARDDPEYFASLLTMRDMDEYIGTRAFHASDIRLVREGKDTGFEEYSKDGVADRHKMLKAFKDGTMLLFSHLNRHHLPLAELISRCEAETHLPMRSNVYLSPPDSQGFKLHWDTHDVLVLQIAGSKRWHIYDSPLGLPHEEHMRELKSWIPRAKKDTELVLRPGSVLYLPRGYIHGAEAEDDHSLHITIGLRSLTVMDIVLGEFKRASLQDLNMRKVAMFDDYRSEQAIESARQALRRVIENMDIENAANDVYKSFIQSRQPPARNALLGLTERQPLDHGTGLRLRRHALFNFFKAEGTISVAVDGAVVTLPEGAEAALEHIRREDSFTPASLPGLEHESRLIFAQSMLDCRLVERVP
jgi:ribosomal protein L16 Arg81 hydroxylase